MDMESMKGYQDGLKEHHACDSLEEFSGVEPVTSNQHNLKQSNIRRDDVDVQKFVEWFQAHPPRDTHSC